MLRVAGPGGNESGAAKRTEGWPRRRLPVKQPVLAIAGMLPAMDCITKLTQDMRGTYSVRTSSGTAYLICLDEPRHVIRLAADTDPVGEYAALETSVLRQDGEEIPLIGLGDLAVGRRGLLVLDIRRDGTVTYRGTTPVLSIVRLQDRPQP